MTVSGVPWQDAFPGRGRRRIRHIRPPAAGTSTAVGARARFGGGDQRSEWVTVYVASGYEEAHIVRGALIAADIPVLLQGESPVLASVATLGVRVKVPRSLVTRAKDLLDGA